MQLMHITLICMYAYTYIKYIYIYIYISIRSVLKHLEAWSPSKAISNKASDAIVFSLVCEVHKSACLKSERVSKPTTEKNA